MKAIIRPKVSILLALFAIAMVGVRINAQAVVTATSPDGGKIEEIYLAKDDGNGAEGERAENFDIADIPIYCIVKLNAPGGTNVKMILLASTVPGVKPGSKVVTTSYTLKEREDRVTFYGQPTDKWLAGKYRVELFVDNKLEKTIDFNIGDAEAAIKAAAKGPKPTVKPATTPTTTRYKSPKP